ncbi:hypothetical protein SMA5143A_8239 [Streptomyces sp. MA5143a]|nr:hypothetical protein SMA5143A_8239 [Streptomyces sp. MA5143a]
MRGGPAQGRLAVLDVLRHSVAGGCRATYGTDDSGSRPDRGQLVRLLGCCQLARGGSVDYLDTIGLCRGLCLCLGAVDYLACGGSVDYLLAIGLCCGYCLFLCIGGFCRGDLRTSRVYSALGCRGCVCGLRLGDLLGGLPELRLRELFGLSLHEPLDLGLRRRFRRFGRPFSRDGARLDHAVDGVGC